MKKFITDISKFSIYACLLYVLLIFIWGNYMPQALKPNLQYAKGAYGFLNTRIKEAKQTRNIDILFLGSSHAYRGFDNRIFAEHGYTTFNLGSSAQTPLQTNVLLKRYLAQLNPKLVIFEIYPGTFSSDGVESALDLMANDKNDFHSWQMMLKTRNLKTFNSMVYALENNLLGIDDRFVEPQKTGEDNYIKGGFVERKMSYYKPTSYDKREWSFNEIQFVAFDETMNLLLEKNIPVLLVFAPVTTSLYSSYTNTTEFESMLKTADKTYLNFNNTNIFIDSLHFYDAHHLNQQGVELFNNILLDTLPGYFIKKDY